jgi:hypothetical protein
LETTHLKAGFPLAKLMASGMMLFRLMAGYIVAAGWLPDLLVQPHRILSK